MLNNDYHFITHWRVQGSVAEIGAVIGDVQSLPRWWPSVYLDVQVLEPGAEDGTGRVVSLYTKGWLPYTLRWNFRVVEVEPYRRIVLRAEGDFVGTGTWTFAQDGEWADVTYDWRISAEKPLLRYLSPLLKPVFSANHHWAMRKGEESLRLELARRRAATDAERARIPPPPGPTTTSPVPLLLAFAALLGALAALGYALRRSGRGER
jgi:hypothetical protein